MAQSRLKRGDVLGQRRAALPDGEGAIHRVVVGIRCLIAAEVMARDVTGLSDPPFPVVGLGGGSLGTSEIEVSVFNRGSVLNVRVGQRSTEHRQLVRAGLCCCSLHSPARGLQLVVLVLTNRVHIRWRTKNLATSSPANSGTPVWPPMLAYSVFT